MEEVSTQINQFIGEGGNVTESGYGENELALKFRNETTGARMIVRFVNGEATVEIIN